MGGILNIFLRYIPSEIMRAPGWGLTGWLSRKVMENANAESSVDLVEELLSGEPTAQLALARYTQGI